MSQTATERSGPASSQATTILLAKGLSKTFTMGDSALQVLKGVDLAVREGEFVAIEGRSGSGKSTLLHLLGALDVPDAGRIEFQGADIASMSGAARAALRNTQVGFVFQFYHLLPELNVTENTLLASMIEHSAIAYRAKHRELHQRAASVLE